MLSVRGTRSKILVSALGCYAESRLKTKLAIFHSLVLGGHGETRGIRVERTAGNGLLNGTAPPDGIQRATVERVPRRGRTLGHTDR